MIRCRCGRWTNYGLTCSQCRTHTFNTGEGKNNSEGEETEEVEEEETEELDLEELIDPLSD
jgi:hypothetical protein